MPRSLPQDMQRFGNLAMRSQLIKLGHSERAIRHAICDRVLVPLRRPWLVATGADPHSVRAVVLGGRLAASSALASHGVWVSRPNGLWVGVTHSASRLPSLRSGEHRVWSHELFPPYDDRRWRMSVADALLQQLRVDVEPDVAASFDSALHQGLITAATLDQIFASAPRRFHRLHGLLNGAAESGLETMMRLGCQARGWQVEVQVKIVGVGRVDLLLDGWLVIELDGGRWHDDAASRDEDYRRDAECILLGYRYHRFRYLQVMHTLPLCLDVIQTILAGGRPPRPSSVR